jgi:hypothetical protein
MWRWATSHVALVNCTRDVCQYHVCRFQTLLVIMKSASHRFCGNHRNYCSKTSVERFLKMRNPVPWFLPFPYEIKM